jgi:hypothetical protein
MADQNEGKSHTGHKGETAAEERHEKFGDRTVGAGMDSPDSTEAVLSAETGEPDPRATEKRTGHNGSPKEA